MRFDANCPPQISRGLEFATALSIQGANGSGKTQLMKALPFVARFCTNSFASDPEDELLFSPFFNNTENSEFFVEFSEDGLQFRYELICTEHKVISEVVYQKKIKKTKIFQRDLNQITYTTAKLDSLKGIKLRKNASIISTAHQYELKGLASLYKFFNKVRSNVGYGGLREKKIDMQSVSKYLYSDDDALQFVSSFISDCDTGIESIKITSRKTEDGKEQFTPLFVHSNEGKNHSVTQYTESSGTKALYRDLPMYRIVLKSGGVLIIDEFDLHLHPLILPKLLGLFSDKESNPRNAQIIFTSHHPDLLDVLGRYRVYLVTKRDNESFALRLDEIPGDMLRNDRSIIPAYKDGKIGGVPRL